MANDIGKEVIDFLNLVKDLNYDVMAIYAQEPTAMHIIGGVLFVVLILIIMINKSLSKSNALKTLTYMQDPENSFELCQSYMNKIVKIMPKAQQQFKELFVSNKDDYYEIQLKLFKDMEIDDKIVKYQEMSKTYQQLSDAIVDNEELAEFYKDTSESLLTDKLFNEISSYIQDLNFSEETVSHMESIVAYANTLEEPELILNKVTDKLQTVDFGSSLDVFMFVRSLDSEKLTQIYDYCIAKQNELFEDENVKISSDILDYLLQNDEKDKVYSYIKTLKLATYLQELNYKYFNQDDNLEFDLIFISNLTEINSDYVDYIETKLTDNWRDDNFIEMLVESENVLNVIGHDRVRQVIQRIDSIRKDYDEKQILDEALQTAKNAEMIAIEAKKIAESNISKN
jgi:hypothetical protein